MDQFTYPSRSIIQSTCSRCSDLKSMLSLIDRSWLKKTTKILGLLLSPFFRLHVFGVGCNNSTPTTTNELSWHILHIVFACCTFNCHYTSIHYIERGFPLSKNPFFQKKEKKTDIALRQHIKKMMTKSYMLMGWPPKNYFWKFCSSSCYNPLTYYAARFLYIGSSL